MDSKRPGDRNDYYLWSRKTSTTWCREGGMAGAVEMWTSKLRHLFLRHEQEITDRKEGQEDPRYLKDVYYTSKKNLGSYKKINDSKH